jgi:RNA polymerase sigma-70 factor (ECF subfamily)
VKVDLKGCIAGRKGAWDAFVQQTAALIYAAVQRTVRTRGLTPSGGGGGEVDDRVQDVYVKLLQDNCRLLRQFDPKRASLSTYLTLVARSTTRDALVKRRLETMPLMDHDGPAPTPGDRNGTLPELESLTDRQREVLQMLFEQDMTVELAAARLGVDPQTIRSTKHKALTRLRGQMKSEGTTDEHE